MILLEQCVCGRTLPDGRFTINNVTIERCECGIQRLFSQQSPSDYEAQYYGQYHIAQDRHPGCVPYKQRYDHDKSIAALRWQEHVCIALAHGTAIVTSLDVGAANGAFVDYLAEQKVNAFGVDPDPNMVGGRVLTGKAAAISQHYCLVTYHDVLEHIIDPQGELNHAAKRLLRPGGLLVIDVPDVSTKAGEHHYKPEHPWYFTELSLQIMCSKAGLKHIETTHPIPGKMVVYAVRNRSENESI